MKKIIFRGAILVLSATTLCTSCIGSFALFNKFAKWNCNATDDKYINAILGFVLSPVYGVCMFVDSIILNTIEFWTGEQVLANAGKTTPMVGTNGDFYLITSTETGYTISNETTKQVSYLRFENNLWSYEANGESTPLLKVNADNTLTIFTREGNEVVVSNDANGVAKVKSLVNPEIPLLTAQY